MGNSAERRAYLTGAREAEVRLLARVESAILGAPLDALTRAAAREMWSADLTHLVEAEVADEGRRNAADAVRMFLLDVVQKLGGNDG